MYSLDENRQRKTWKQNYGRGLEKTTQRGLRPPSSTQAHFICNQITFRPFEVGASTQHLIGQELTKDWHQKEVTFWGKDGRTRFELATATGIDQCKHSWHWEEESSWSSLTSRSPQKPHKPESVGRHYERLSGFLSSSNSLWLSRYQVHTDSDSAAKWGHSSSWSHIKINTCLKQFNTDTNYLQSGTTLFCWKQSDNMSIDCNTKKHEITAHNFINGC